MLIRTDFSRWRSLWDSLHASGDPAPWHARLQSAYGENTRFYHNLQHLEECLLEFDRVHSIVQQPDVLEAALWFHDAVYDPRSTTNEEDSAQLAFECFSKAKVAPETVEQIRQLILSTKSHEPISAGDGSLLIDIDLAILGQPAVRFWDYERAIRAEYAYVPEATFAEKRAQILQRFLERSSIYRTDPFRIRYESTARNNLEAAIARLRSESK